MSFLNSVLSSIETGEVSFTPPPPPKSTTPDSTSSGPKPSLNSKLAATSISGNNGYTGTSHKRKAGEELPRPAAPRNERFPKTLPERFASSQSSTPTPRSPRDSDAVRKPGSKPASSNSNASKPALAKPNAAAVSSKPPPKGSYAAMMAEAKALQTKAPAAVGLIRHQAVPKDKKSKVQQKRMTEEAKQREPVNRKTSSDRPGAAPASRSTKDAILKARQAEVSKQDTYKGTARPRPGSQPPTKSSEPAYTGTSGLPPRRTPGKDGLYGRNRGRSAVRNEYLATDEEDEGDYGYEDDEEGLYSDESDMEAGFLDVEQEEQAALRIARREDEEELRLEMAAKKEKMERKMKLNALAKSRR
ncbi:uncharacterized protein GIQ15_04856 [Arthroderma uncinatum]|uniref:uncharacterized protein n=1 Tax=Arthroderma uncinatum TaxID=74035 RepID=UPI00144ADCA1|nr:uncharacterized protein GIQ15_04856 [Arthroderma uncinatum]KAF3482097.1 hypothetical protein GIQ15_04856 [Arthroderma uncinatum]